MHVRHSAGAWEKPRCAGVLVAIARIAPPGRPPAAESFAVFCRFLGPSRRLPPPSSVGTPPQRL